MKRSRHLSVPLGVALATLISPAAAQEFPTSNPEFEAPTYSLPAAVNPFGGKGQIAFGANFRLSFQHDIFSPPQGESSSQDVFVLAPMVDYFVVDDFAVGAVAAIEHHKLERGSSLRLTAGPELGYNVPLGSGRSSIFPRVGVAYTRTSVDDGSVTTTQIGVTVFARAPLLLHVGKNFFIGVGPYFSKDVHSKSRGRDAGKLTTIGLGAEIGGWL